MKNRELQIGIGFVAVATFVTANLLSIAFQGDPKTFVEQPIPVAERSTTALLNTPRTKNICGELLNRPDVDPATLRASLIRLGTLSDESSFETFIQLLESLNNTSPKSLLRNLTSLSLYLAEDSEEELRQSLTKHAQGRYNSYTRQVAYASLIAIDGNADGPFSTTDYESLCDVVDCLPLIDQYSMEGSLYVHLRPLITERDAYGDQLHTASLAAALNMPHVHQEFVPDLIDLVRQSNCHSTVATILASMPVEELPESDLGSVAAELIARIVQLKIKKTSSGDIEPLVQQCRAIGQRLPPAKRQRIEDRLQQLFDNAKK